MHFSVSLNLPLPRGCSLRPASVQGASNSTPVKIIYSYMIRSTQTSIEISLNFSQIQVSRLVPISQSKNVYQ